MHLWPPRPDVKAQRLGLQVCISLRHAVVLAQVLGPRLDEKPFHHPLGVGRMLLQAPGIGAVAAALERQLLWILDPANGAQGSCE